MDTSDDDLIWDIRKKIGMVFQNPDNPDCILRGWRWSGIRSWKHRDRESELEVNNALKSVGMYEYRNREAHKLWRTEAAIGAVAMRPVA